MNKPTDYPVDAKQTTKTQDSAAADITYAQLKDRVDANKPVTDEMIQIARAKLDSAHTHPNKADSVTEQSKFKLSTIRDKFRTE